MWLGMGKGQVLCGWSYASLFHKMWGLLLKSLHTAIQDNLYPKELATFQIFLKRKTVKPTAQFDKCGRDIPNPKCYFLHITFLQIIR